MAQVTHEYDDDKECMVQIVSPVELRRILDDQGDSYEPPSDWDVADEWAVATDDEYETATRYAAWPCM